MFRAGFAGDHAIRAVLSLIGDRLKIFGIMVDIDQKVCVSLRSSFVFQHNAWFGSGYNLRSSTDFFVFQRNAWFDSGYMCRARRLVGSGMIFAGLLVTMISRCVHFVVGRPVESSQVQSLRQFQLLALPTGMWGRLFGGPVHRHRARGHVLRDMTPIIRSIHAVVTTKTLLLHLVRTTTATTTTATTTHHNTPQHTTTHHATPRHTTPHHTTPHHTTPHHTTPHHTTPHHTTPHHTTPPQHSTAQHSTAQNRTAQHSTAQHNTAHTQHTQHSHNTQHTQHTTTRTP